MVFIAVKRHYGHGNSYKENIYWDGSLTVLEVQSIIIMMGACQHSGRHDAGAEKHTSFWEQKIS